MEKIRFGNFIQGKMYLGIENDILVIERKGVIQFFRNGLKGEKRIQIKDISAIQLKKPGLVMGYIQFIIMGSQENENGLYGALCDENTVIITNKKQYEKALEIRTYIEKYKKKDSDNNYDMLLDLKKLLDNGAITKAEYEKEKQELLDN